MSLLASSRKYLVNLPTGKVILWCYLIWYLVIVIRYFDPSPTLWLNSLGISVIIGFALLLSTGHRSAWFKNRWQTFRLFMMPFGVSSLSSLIKGRGFILIIPPSLLDVALTVGSCAAFVFLVFALKRFSADTSNQAEACRRIA